MKKKERTLGEVLRAVGSDMRSQAPGIAMNTGRVLAGAGQSGLNMGLGATEAGLRLGKFLGRPMGATNQLADSVATTRGMLNRNTFTQNTHGKVGAALPYALGGVGILRGIASILPRAKEPAKQVITKVVTKKKDSLPKKKNSKKKDPKNKEFIPHPSVDDIGEKTVAGMTRNQKQVASEWQRQGYMKKDKHGNWKQTNKK
jgi:hypothetical protein